MGDRGGGRQRKIQNEEERKRDKREKERERNKMPVRRYVQIGRVCLVHRGENEGKLVIIVDIIDQNRALVDWPDMERQQMNLKRLNLTDMVLDISRTPKKKDLIKAIEEGDVEKKFASTLWGKKLAARKAKLATTDFDRYKAMVKKIKENSAIRAKLG